ncbi:taste receptor type 2 member 40-like [Hyla sarda]|uniref:taste receptor type 2 member 40-like n=1 Tax=Hyla sarda TaxID=327740 RepID=UPI0024C449B4|nr:taste receptor type 2 member 40-like [Hyla sarda]
MASTLHVIFSSIFFIEILLGIIINGFIVIAICIEWKKQRQIHPGDQILLCLVLSRLSLLLTVLATNILLTFFPHLRVHASEYFIMVRLLFSYSSIWFATLLSVFYCVKITTYNHPLFMYIKTRISKLVPWFIAGCSLASLSSSLPVGWCVFTKHILDPSNVTSHIDSKSANFFNLFLIYNFGSSPPLVLCCVSVVLLMRYLSAHTRVMQENRGFRNPNLQSHYRILRSTTCFFLLYFAYYIIVNLTTTGIVTHDSPWIILCSIFTSVTPVLHSVILILSNSKLRQASKSLFCHPRHFKQEVKSLNHLPNTEPLGRLEDGE